MISVVMPAHNEESFLEPAVKAVVAGLRGRQQQFELFVSENGSTDQTLAEARSLANTFPEVSVITAATADYGLALRAGFEASTGEVVVNFDVDLVDLEFMDRALAILADDKVVVVVGSKRSAGADDRRNISRRTVTAVFSLVLRHGFGLKVSDTHGLKVLHRSALVPIVEACRFGGDIFDTELILRCERSGLDVGEIPVVVNEMRAPRTPITRRIPRALIGLVRLRISLR